MKSECGSRNGRVEAKIVIAVVRNIERIPLDHDEHPDSLITTRVRIAVTPSSAHPFHSNVLLWIVVFPPAISGAHTPHVVVLFLRSLAPRITGPVDRSAEVDVVYRNACDEDRRRA